MNYADVQEYFEGLVVKAIVYIFGSSTGEDYGNIPDSAFMVIFNTIVCLFWCGFYGSITAMLWDKPLALLGFYLLVSCCYMGWFIVTTALKQNGLVYYMPRGIQKLLLQTYVVIILGICLLSPVSCI